MFLRSNCVPAHLHTLFTYAICETTKWPSILFFKFVKHPCTRDCVNGQIPYSRDILSRQISPPRAASPLPTDIDRCIIGEARKELLCIYRRHETGSDRTEKVLKLSTPVWPMICSEVILWLKGECWLIKEHVILGVQK